MEEKDNSSGKNHLDDNEESNFKDKKINVEVSNKERRAVKHRDGKETIDSSNIDCDIKKDNPIERDPDNIKTESENINEDIGMDSKELNQKVDDLTVQVEFKKPTIIIGPRRGKRKKISSIIKVEQEIEQNEKESNAPLDKVMSSAKHTTSSNEKAITGSLKSHKTIALKYQEPCWGTKPDDEYKLEVLKSGVIIQTIDLTEKSYHVVGRLPNCDISLAHPTISRFHAVIQYRGIEDECNTKGLYIYDLGSTHGTYWNGNRVPPNAYVRLHDSHIIKFGCSARKYILQALHETKEEESELSFTELREKRMLEIQEREKIKAAQRSKMIEEERLKREDVEENEGIDWGMGEDADEETDLTENPYAATNNEELYLNDPKKSLRGWFEREGYDLQYHTEEKGFAQFLCWVDLPIESIAGHTVRAEALVKGKKKECVVQCALEACKILDRYGLLRQATHEGRKRKVKNWEEDDYYSSDEDNFLDRTGSIEKKRKRRMRLAGKLEPQEEDTYNSLMEKHTTVVKKITDLVECMRRSQKFENESSKSVENADEDALDAFMSSLNATVLTKADKRKLKIELQDLRQEEARLIKLLNPLRPSNLPPLIIHIVPLNEVKKSTEIFDNDQSMDQRKNRQISNDETTSGHHNNISQSKQNDYDSLNEEESRENNEGDNNLKTNTDEISNNLDSHREETEIPEGISAREVEDNLLCVENLSVGKTTLYEDANNVSSSDRSSTKKSKRVTKKEVKEIYDKDVYNENYSTWVPPQNQTGDGKTSLNDKYGY